MTHMAVNDDVDDMFSRKSTPVQGASKVRRLADTTKHDHASTCPFVSLDHSTLQTGGGFVDDGSPLGKLGRPQNAGACIAACRANLFELLQVENNDDDQLCRILSRIEAKDEFWNLYCCDHNPCGVWINAIGHDPNVDLIINRCQNRGYFGIRDPGPPPKHHCQRWQNKQAAQGVFTCNTHKGNTGRGGADGGSESNMPTGVTSSPTSSNTSASVASSATNDMTNPTSLPPTANTAMGKHSLSTAHKAVVGVFSALGFLALLGLAFCLVCMRGRQKNISHSRRRKAHLGKRYHETAFSKPNKAERSSRTSLSPMPLLPQSHELKATMGHSTPPHSPPQYSPTRSAKIRPWSPTQSSTASVPLSPLLPHQSSARQVLTPPPRLCDRPFLDSAFIRRSPSAAGVETRPITPVSPAHVAHQSQQDRTFPVAPFCAPTSCKLAPRVEWSPRVYAAATAAAAAAAANGVTPAQPNTATSSNTSDPKANSPGSPCNANTNAIGGGAARPGVRDTTWPPTWASLRPARLPHDRPHGPPDEDPSKIGLAMTAATPIQPQPVRSARSSPYSPLSPQSSLQPSPQLSPQSLSSQAARARAATAGPATASYGASPSPGSLRGALTNELTSPPPTPPPIRALPTPPPVTASYHHRHHRRRGPPPALSLARPAGSLGTATPALSSLRRASSSHQKLHNPTSPFSSPPLSLVEAPDVSASSRLQRTLPPELLQKYGGDPDLVHPLERECYLSVSSTSSERSVPPPGSVGATS